jgi:hypothetical protein
MIALLVDLGARSIGTEPTRCGLTRAQHASARSRSAPDQASILLAGPLLADSARSPCHRRVERHRPRRVDTHFLALEQLGAG